MKPIDMSRRGFLRRLDYTATTVFPGGCAVLLAEPRVVGYINYPPADRAFWRQFMRPGTFDYLPDLTVVRWEAPDGERYDFMVRCVATLPSRGTVHGSAT